MNQFPYMPGQTPNPYVWNPYTFGAPQNFPVPGYATPYQEPPTALFAPPNHGNVKYNYRVIGNPNGGPPNQGRVPGLDSSPYNLAASNPMPMGMPMFPSHAPMGTGMCPPPVPPCPIPNFTNASRQDQEYEHEFDGADFVVKYFAENPVHKYNDQRRNDFVIPAGVAWHSKKFRRDMTIADVIMDLGCWKRASHRKTYPKSHCGIQQLLPVSPIMSTNVGTTVSPTNCLLGTMIMQEEEKAQWTIERLWGADTKEIWVARLPV